MTTAGKFFLVGGLALLSGALEATAGCPDNIQYTGGGYLKHGDSYYYREGGFLLRSGTLYYPNGGFLRRGDKVYYGNGNYLQSGDSLYYPNGAFLRRGQDYYYANGGFLKRGENFYYSNAVWARHNGKLYRPDGTETPFPVLLQESIAGIGMLTARVEATTELVGIDFRDLFVLTSDVRGRAFWDGKAFSEFEFEIGTGMPGEWILLKIAGEAVTCSLAGQSGQTFTVHGAAGTAHVEVRPGHDPFAVRSAILRALDSTR